MKNIFSKLFQKSVSQKPMVIKPLNININQTPEKFQHFATEIVEFLIPKLQMLDKIENDIFKKHQILETKRISDNQTHPDEKKLWEEYAQRREEILNPITLKNHNGGSISFSKPTKYEYLNYPDTKIFFIMKSENRAIVETEFEEGIAKREQFILKKDDMGWKIDEKKYSFAGEDTWQKDDI